MASHIDEQLARIRDDRASGASELADAGLRLLADACAAEASDGPDAMLAAAADLARRLATIRPSMAPLGNWAACFHASLRETLADGSVPPEETGARTLNKVFARKASVRESLVNGARPVLGGVRGILTLSYSSTIEDLLARAIGPDCLVTVAESRPLYEGRTLCRRLEAVGRRVRCITDAQVGHALADADMVLIGADAILADLAVVNKVGSLLAALAARARGKPCHVAADTYKIDPHATSADAVFEEMDASEVWPERPELCANVYFEAVPGDLIDLYLTEKGPLTAERMRDEVADRRRSRRALDVGT